MKNLAYFLVGLILLPIMMLATFIMWIKKLITYIRDCGEDFIDKVRF